MHIWSLSPKNEELTSGGQERLGRAVSLAPQLPFPIQGQATTPAQSFAQYKRLR
jgi:hypothetical protein